jgi:cystathionine beta-lyase
LSDEVADSCLTFFAPSKTFNIAGLVSGVAVASYKEIYDKYNFCLKRLHLTEGNLYGVVGLEAAYNYGEEWLEQLLEYLSANAKFVVDFFEKNLPQVKTKHPEGSYLQWIDFSAFNLSQRELVDFFVYEAKVGMNDGTVFSKTGGVGFMRLNLASPRAIIEKALNQILAAYNKRQK